MVRSLLANRIVSVETEAQTEITRFLSRVDSTSADKIVKEYEDTLSELLGGVSVLACCNGTSALYMGLRAAGVSHDMEVILPATATVMSALPILALGARPVFADTSLMDLFSYDLSDLDRKITDRTRAILNVSMWGYPVEIQALAELAAQRSVPILEDSAQALGTSMFEGHFGTTAEIGIFSTGADKLIYTGEGGFVTTNSDALYRRMRELRSYGGLQTVKGVHGVSNQLGIAFGMNFKMNPLGALLGISHAKTLARRLKRRYNNAQRLLSRIEQSDRIREIPYPPGGRPNYYSLLLVVDSNYGSARQLGRFMLSKRIVADTYQVDYRPLYTLPLFKAYSSPCPKAEITTSQVIALPTHELMTEEDTDRVAAALEAWSGGD